MNCSGNLLNLDNPLDEKAVAAKCDRENDQNANCLLEISITVIPSKRTLIFNAYQFVDNNSWKTQSSFQIDPSITIHSIVLLNFPEV